MEYTLFPCATNKERMKQTDKLLLSIMVSRSIKGLSGLGQYKHPEKRRGNYNNLHRLNFLSGLSPYKSPEGKTETETL